MLVLIEGFLWYAGMYNVEKIKNLDGWLWECQMTKKS